MDRITQNSDIHKSKDDTTERIASAVAATDQDITTRLRDATRMAAGAVDTASNSLAQGAASIGFAINHTAGAAKEVWRRACVIALDHAP